MHTFAYKNGLLYSENVNLQELADKEETEITVLKQFMPAELSREEVASILEAAMEETGASTKKDMGRVMKLMQERTAGRFNGKELAQMVSASLS